MSVIAGCLCVQSCEQSAGDVMNFWRNGNPLIWKGYASGTCVFRNLPTVEILIQHVLRHLSMSSVNLLLLSKWNASNVEGEFHRKREVCDIWSFNLNTTTFPAVYVRKTGCEHFMWNVQVLPKLLARCAYPQPWIEALLTNFCCQFAPTTKTCGVVKHFCSFIKLKILGYEVYTYQKMAWR